MADVDGIQVLVVGRPLHKYLPARKKRRPSLIKTLATLFFPFSLSLSHTHTLANLVVKVVAVVGYKDVDVSHDFKDVQPLQAKRPNNVTSALQHFPPLPTSTSSPRP